MFREKWFHIVVSPVAFLFFSAPRTRMSCIHYTMRFDNPFILKFFFIMKWKADFFATAQCIQQWKSFIENFKHKKLRLAFFLVRGRLGCCSFEIRHFFLFKLKKFFPSPFIVDTVLRFEWKYMRLLNNRHVSCSMHKVGENFDGRTSLWWFQSVRCDDIFSKLRKFHVEMIKVSNWILLTTRRMSNEN